MEITYRAYQPQDQEEILRLLDEAHLNPSSLAHCVRHFPQYGLVAEAGGQIVGCGFHGEPDQEGRTICELYVCPEARRKRIGTTLLWRLQDSMRKLGVTQMICDFEKAPNEIAFATVKGLAEMYVSRYMSYSGARYPEPEGDFMPYQDSDYLEVQKLMSEAFFQMRSGQGKSNLKPEEPCDEQREEYRKAASNIFVCRQNGEIVAVAMLDENEITTLAVRVDKQRGGLGKAMLSYAVNILKDRGYEKAYLWVGAGNPAIRLFHHMQWVVESTHIFASKELTD